MNGVQSPTDILSTISTMRIAVFHAWQQFSAKLPVDGLTPEDCWLLLQLSSGPATHQDIEVGLSLFVDDPDALIAKAISRGWVRELPGEQVGYELTDDARRFFRRLLPIAQTANTSWRATLGAEQPAPGELDVVLRMLQGRPSTGS